MNIPELSPRLCAVAEFVRSPSKVADVGTDHAYLPIYLVLTEKALAAVASDINEGPYLRAKQNVEAAGLDKKITTLCTPGLCGIESFSPTDILVCGMGGELIASILRDAPWTRDENIRLILQPMTHPEILREFLIENGYSIVGERLAKEEKIYQIICAQYTDSADTAYTDAELLFGKLSAHEDLSLLPEITDIRIKTLEKIKLSKLEGGADTSAEDKLIAEIKEYRNDCKGII